MKIIDEKGRIFGKINVIDFSVVLFLVFLMPMFYFGYKILNTKKPFVEKQTIQTKIKFLEVLAEVADAMKEGDVIRDSEGNIMGTLSKILSNKALEDPQNREVLIIRDSEGNIMGTLSKILNNEIPKVSNSYKTREVVAVFDLNCTTRCGTLYCGNYAIKMGLPIDLASDWYVLKGIIIGAKNN